MKSFLPPLFNYPAFFLVFFGLAVATTCLPPLTAQESRAAQGIRNRIESGGGKVGAQPNAAAQNAMAATSKDGPKTQEQIDAERAARRAARVEAHNRRNGQDATVAPTGQPVAPGDAVVPDKEEKPVKKEHDPVEIIGEPYLVYDHYSKGNSDLVNKNVGEADQTADRPVTAVIADQDGLAAVSAGKDSTIQLWYTYDFYADYFADLFGDYYDADYDPTIGTGQVSASQQGQSSATQDVSPRRGNTKVGQNSAGQNPASQQTAGGRNTRGDQAGEAAAARRSQNAAMRQTDPFRRQQSAAGGTQTKNNGSFYSNSIDGYDDAYSFYSSRQGNLRVQIPTKDALIEQAAVADGKNKKKSNTDWFSDNPFQNWSKDPKKRRKPPTTLGKLYIFYERLNMMGEREGQGYSDLMTFTHELPQGNQTVLYTADYNGKICWIDLDLKKGKGFPYARKKAVKNTMWGVAVYRGYRYDYKNGVYRDLVAGANNNGNIYFWDAYSRKLLKAVTVSSTDDPKMRPVLDINFAPDCSVVTAGMDGCARVITLPSMEIVSLLKGHKGPIFSAVFDETGQYVLTGSKDKSACLWDTASGEIIASFIGHTGAVRKVQFLTDRYILTCSDDKTARIWELPDDVSLSIQSEPLFTLDENGNPVDEEGKPVDVSALNDAGWGTSSSSIEDELFAVDEEGDEENTQEKPGKDADEDGSENEEESPETQANAQGINEAEVPEQSIADAPRGYEVFRFEGPSPVFSMSVNDYYLFTGCQDGKVRVWDIYPFIEKVTGTNANVDPNDPSAQGVRENFPPGMPVPPIAAGAQGGMPPVPTPAQGGANGSAGRN